MENPDSLRMCKEILQNNHQHTEYVISWATIIIPAACSIIIAFLTAFFTKRVEIAKIKAEQESLNEKISYDIKQMLLSIESENYKKLYEQKLEALKNIKKIRFELFETQTEEFESISDYMQNFPYAELISKFHNLIIDYSHIFNGEIVTLMKDIYRDTQYTKDNYDPESSSWMSFNDRIFEKYDNLISLVSEDLKLDINSIEKKFK